MGAVLPVGLLTPSEPQPRLMDQRRGLEGLARGLVCHLGGRKFPQLPVDKRQQLVGGLGITPFDLLQNEGQVTHETRVTETGLESKRESLGDEPIGRD